MGRHLAVLVVVSAVMAPAAVAEPAKVRAPEATPLAPCDGRTVRIRYDRKADEADEDVGPWFVTRGGTDVFDSGARAEWIVDINRDGRRDVGLMGRDSCAGGGCEIGVFVNCGHGRYAAVFGPVYSQGIRPARTSGTTGWRELLEDVIRGEATGDARMVTVRRRFDGERYR